LTNADDLHEGAASLSQIPAKLTAHPPRSSLISFLHRFISIPSSSAYSSNDCARLRSHYRQVRILRRHEQRTAPWWHILPEIFNFRLYWRNLLSVITHPYRVALYNILDLLMDLGFALMYLIEIQMDYPVDGKFYLVSRPYPIYVAAVILSLHNLVSLSLRWLFTTTNVGRALTFNFLVDLLTSIPFLIMFVSAQDTRFIYVPYFLRAWIVIDRLKRVMRLQLEFKLTNWSIDALTERLVILICTILVIIYSALCAFQYCEMMFANIRYDVLTSGYFTIITMSTVGYGDVTPKSFGGKLVVVVLIIVALSLLPGLIRDIIDTVNQRKGNHIIVFYPLIYNV
jgi:voltage-gated potassium channel Kch